MVLHLLDERRLLFLVGGRYPCQFMLQALVAYGVLAGARSNRNAVRKVRFNFSRAFRIVREWIHFLRKIAELLTVFRNGTRGGMDRLAPEKHGQQQTGGQQRSTVVHPMGGAAIAVCT